METVGNEHIEGPSVVEIVKLIEKDLPEQARRKAVRTIYRVPKLLSQANDKGFEPQLLSIGPFHHGKEGLKPMEQKKLQYLRAILSRNGKELKDCVEEIMKLEAQARECYSETIRLGSNEFAKMMVVDGCFLVEMFLRIRSKNKETLPKFISQEIWLPQFVNHDMLLLENQIPFFILQGIFYFVEEPGSIKDLALDCFRVFPVMPLNDDPKPKATESYHHLLDLFHHHCLPSTPRPWEKNDEADSDIEEQFQSDLERLGFKPLEEPLGITPLEEPLLLQVRRGLYAPFEGSRIVTRAAMKPREELPPNLEVRIEGTPVEEHSLPEERREEVTLLAEPLLPQVQRAVYKPSECSSIVPTDEMMRRGVYRPIEGSGIAKRGVVKPREESNGRRKQPGKKLELFAIPSAEELQDAGIKFKSKEEEKPGSFLDIEFHKKGGVMKIPYLFVSDNLRFILINLIAYEQCDPKAGTFFTGYAFFMDDLINTAKDVRILRKSRILEHGLGSDKELAQHFNQLSKGVLHHPEATYLYKERKKINAYCGDPWNIARGDLVREYFYSPWAAISLAGALLALALSIFNTGLSIYSTFYA